MILTAEFRFAGGYSVRRVATDFYYSLATDAAGVQEFAGRMVGVPTFATRVGCIIWGNRTSSSIGDIEIANPDGGVTSWLALPYRDCECILKLVNPGESYDSATTVSVCIIDDIEQEENSIRISLRGKDTLLDKPLQPLTYTAAQAVDATSIEGNTIPVCIGRVWQAEPTLIDVNSLEYQFTDSYYGSIIEVLSGGSVANPPTESPDDWAYTDTGFRMLNTPSARITLNAVGNRRLVDALISDLFLASEWTGNTPNGWTVSGGTAGVEITRIASIGCRFDDNGGADPAISYAAPQGVWYFVVGEIVNRVSGGLRVRFGTEYTDYAREGRFCAIGLVESGADIDVIGIDDADLTVSFLHVHSMDAGSASLFFRYALLNVCARAGLRISGSALEATTPDVPTYAVGLYSNSALTARDALQMLMDSVSGWTFPNCAGELIFGYYDLPSVATPVLTISSLNLLAYPTFKPDNAPGLSTRVAGGKNWSPYSDNELAGITYPNRPPFIDEFRFVRTGASANSLARQYSHALSAEPIETMIATGPPTQEEADRITAITTEGRGFWECTVALEAVSGLVDVIPQANVLLQGDFFGADDGKVARIVGVEGQMNSPVLKIVCWGATTP